jgi:hypothetical protein
MSKLSILADQCGMEVEELLSEGIYDSVCMGICTNKGCDYSTEVEPDCDSGYCEECGTQTVKSACVLAGII